MGNNDTKGLTGINTRRPILDTVPGLILEVDQDLVIILANRETCNRWKFIVEGKTGFDELFGRGASQPNVVDLREDKHSPLLRAKSQELRANVQNPLVAEGIQSTVLAPQPGPHILEETFRLKKSRSGEISTPDGEVFTIKTEYMKEEALPRAVVHMVEITDRVEMEKKLEMISKKHHDQLLQADKMISLGILASGMAHEINNPNNSIMLNAAILEKAWNSLIPILNELYKDREDLRIGGVKYEKMKGRMPKLFSGILDSSKKIQRIVNDLKYFSGKDLISLKSQLDMESVVKSAISLTTNMIHKSTRNFKAVYEKNLPNVMGNFQNLEQVIINLIQNACQALESPESGIFITITYNRTNREIVTAVKDEGIGIPEKDLKYISEPFFTSKRSSGGTGLGLYVSSKIINDHGGALHFISSPGRGTTVEVRLPAIEVS